MRKPYWKNWSGFGGAALLFALFLCTSGCAGPKDPLVKINHALRGVPDYSLILGDMKKEGSLFKSYYHKYKIITPEETYNLDWAEVPKKSFQTYLPFLGMTIYVKKDGKGADRVGPPGYEYVGHRHYGHWQTGSSGHSFWVFYGQYRFMSDIMGGGRIYRNDYNTYRTYGAQGRPYYGPNKQYGTNGSFTKRTNPDFYSRRTAAELTKKASFRQRVNKRIGRTRTSSRARGGGRGK